LSALIPGRLSIEGADVAGIGGRIRELRGRKGFSQKQLAIRAGVSRNTIVRTETGETVPSSALIVKIARALGAEPGDLFVSPAPLDVEDLIARPQVQEWLAEQGHKSEEEFLDEAAEYNSLDEVEDALDEMQLFRDRLLEDLRKTSTRRRLFPIEPGDSSASSASSKEEATRSLLGRASLANRLRWEIRHECLVREAVLSNHSKQLFVLGEAEDYLTRSGARDPRAHERLKRRRALQESYAAAAAL